MKVIFYIVTTQFKVLLIFYSANQLSEILLMQVLRTVIPTCNLGTQTLEFRTQKLLCITGILFSHGIYDDSLLLYTCKKSNL